MRLPRVWSCLLAGLCSTHLAAQPLTPVPELRPITSAVRVYGDEHCVRPRVIAAGVQEWLGIDELPAAWTVVILARDGQVQFSIFERGKLLAQRRFAELRAGCPDLEAALEASIGLSLETLLIRRANAAIENEAREEARIEEEAVEPTDYEGPPISLVLAATVAPTTLVRPALGGTLYFELGPLHRPRQPSAFRSRLGVLALRAEDVDLKEVPGARLATQLMAARVGQCWGRSQPTFRLQACSDFMAGYVSGRGEGELRPLSVHLPWAALAASAEGRWQVTEPVALFAGVQGQAHLLRPTFRVMSEGGSSVEELKLPALGVMLHVGATWTYR